MGLGRGVLVGRVVGVVISISVAVSSRSTIAKHGVLLVFAINEIVTCSNMQTDC